MNIELDTPLYIWQQGKRQNQEDALYPLPQAANSQDRCFILCDGMGGHEKGEVASNIVSCTMGQWINRHLAKGENISPSLVEACLSAAYQDLNEADTSEQEERRMGTTLALLCLTAKGCMMAHIGDSRIYHIRPSERRILYKSRDHSVVSDLLHAGEITENEARTSPSRNMLTRAIIAHQAVRVTPDYNTTLDVRAGDCFLLCSDGLLEQMTDQDIVDILSSQYTETRKISELRKRCLDNQDNYSAWLITIKQANCKSQTSSNGQIPPKKRSKWQILLKKFEHILNNV